MAYFDHDYKKFPELTNSQLQIMQFSSPHTQITEDFKAEVIKVHDGDTITLRTQTRDFDFPLRFLNINAPELSEGGEEAKQWLKKRIEGEEVQIKINRYNRVGKYGRLLGKVVNLGLDVGEEMLRNGLVTTFARRNDGKIPPMHKTFNIRQWL